jgi:hypothetical protein
MTKRALTLGVLVPCRNEQRVIGRRLANLLTSVWPESGAHRLLVVNDGSDDETARIAAETIEAATSSAVSCEVIENAHAPGKNGAIRTGLERFGEEVDVVVLTDADVVTDPGALAAVAAAFEEEPQLGMASGVQALHSSLPRDGSVPLEETAMGLYDSWTRAVRRMESKSGRLFSVHGQLLAWRLDLGLSPGALVADDLELMLELRRRYPSHRVRMVEGARFHEERSSERGAQDLRRARAYLQAVPLMDATTLGVQGWIYRHLPPSAPALAALAIIAAGACAWIEWGLYGLSALLSLACLLYAHPAVRRVLSLLWVIEQARRAERDGSQAIRWETARA